ncbi:hypothetical protein M3J09_012538 [Ascochyta lentis]
MTNLNPHIAIADGYQTFTSSASTTEPPFPLWVTLFTTFVVYHIAGILLADLSTIVNVIKSIYRASIDKLKHIYTASLIAAQLCIALDRVSNSTPETNKAITLEILNFRGTECVAAICCLPANLSVNTTPTSSDRTDEPTTEPTQITTPRSGLWEGTCVSDTAEIHSPTTSSFDRTDVE